MTANVRMTGLRALMSRAGLAENPTYSAQARIFLSGRFAETWEHRLCFRGAVLFSNELPFAFPLRGECGRQRVCFDRGRFVHSWILGHL